MKLLAEQQTVQNNSVKLFITLVTCEYNADVTDNWRVIAISAAEEELGRLFMVSQLTVHSQAVVGQFLSDVGMAYRYL